MIVCVVCRNPEPEGELFCSECGARLSVNRPGTGPAATLAFPASSARLNAAAAPAGAIAVQRPGQISLLVSGADKAIILQNRPEYILGREGNEQVVPDLNLNEYGARDKGVSRVHAALRRDGSQLVLVDLGSTNGTRLNGQPVPPNQPALVSNGDEIKLGKLSLRISF